MFAAAVDPLGSVLLRIRAQFGPNCTIGYVTPGRESASRRALLESIVHDATDSTASLTSASSTRLAFAADEGDSGEEIARTLGITVFRVASWKHMRNLSDAIRSRGAFLFLLMNHDILIYDFDFDCITAAHIMTRSFFESSLCLLLCFVICVSKGRGGIGAIARRFERIGANGQENDDDGEEEEEEGDVAGGMSDDDEEASD